jgi:hypothetical protein
VHGTHPARGPGQGGNRTSFKPGTPKPEDALRAPLVRSRPHTLPPCPHTPRASVPNGRITLVVDGTRSARADPFAAEQRGRVCCGAYSAVTAAHPRR